MCSRSSCPGPCFGGGGGGGRRGGGRGALHSYRGAEAENDICNRARNSVSVPAILLTATGERIDFDYFHMENNQLGARSNSEKYRPELE